MRASESVTDTETPTDVLSRIDDTISKLDQMRDELRAIREWAEMVQQVSREAVE